MPGETLNVAHMYLQVRWRNQGNKVMGIKFLFVGRFKRKLFCHNRLENIAYPKQWRRGCLNHDKMDLQINIPRKNIVYLTHIYKWTKHYFSSCQDETSFV